MTLTELYDRGYALGTGAHILHTDSGEVYILANVDDFMQCAINITTGNRFRDSSRFSCSFQMDRASATAACGHLDEWEVVV